MMATHPSMRVASLALSLIALLLLLSSPLHVVAHDDAVHDGTGPLSLLYFFPEECPTSNHTCCPSSGVDQLECGGPIRGSCAAMDEPGTNRCGFEADGGLGSWWFYTNFRNACVCTGNYWGVACEQCAPGWMGDSCSERSPTRIRRDFAKLSDDDKQYIIDAFILLKETPAPFQPAINWFDWLAGGHYWAMRATAEADLDLGLFPQLTGLSIDPGHDGPASPVYHRRLVYQMELALATVTNNATFVLPYWNWTSSTGNNNDEVIRWYGGDGEGLHCRYFPESLTNSDVPKGCDCNVTQGPFAGWHQIGLWGRARKETLQRAFNCQSKFGPSTPQQWAGDFIPTVPLFYSETNQTWSFRQLLGGGAMNTVSYSWPRAAGVSDMHKRIHRWMAGSMVGNATASDPIFYMLHGFADLIMERWIRNGVARGWYNNSWNAWPAIDMNVGQNLYDCTAPFLPLVPHADFFVPSTRLGYDFDFFDGCSEAVGDDTGESCLAAVSPVSKSTESIDSQFGSVWPIVVEGNETPTNEAFFFPNECVDNTERTCCPVASDNGLQCGGDIRGTCIDVSAKYDNTSGSLWWITANYDYVCQCATNWDGAACDRCAAGYTGDNCTEAASVRIRRNFETLTDTERQVIIDAFNTLQNMSSEYHPLTSSSSWFASTYYWTQYTGADQIVDEFYVNLAMARGPSALMVRRRLLLDVERRIGVLIGDTNFALPYWDWSSSMSNDNDLTLRWFGGDGVTDDDTCRQATISHIDNETLIGCNCVLGRLPFMATFATGYWGEKLVNKLGTEFVVQRAFGCRPTAPSLPTHDVVDAVLSIKTFHADDDVTPCFWKALSGMKYDGIKSTWPPSGFPGSDYDMYARVFEFIGGIHTGTSSSASPASDPLFWLHAAYADLLLDSWYNAADVADREWPSQNQLIGHAANEIVAPFYPLQTNAQLFQSATKLGYTYDTSIEATKIGKAEAEIKATQELMAQLSGSNSRISNKKKTAIQSAASEASEASVHQSVQHEDEDVLAKQTSFAKKANRLHAKRH